MLDGLEIYKALTHLLPYDSIQDTEVIKVDTQGKTTEQVNREKLEAEQKYYTGGYRSGIQVSQVNRYDVCWYDWWTGG